MKVLIYVLISLTGPAQAGEAEIEIDEMLSLDCSLPALPRIGDTMELNGCQEFVGSTTVESVTWFPYTDKINVFFPVVYLEKDDYFDKRHGFTPGTTVKEKLLVLKELVMENRSRKSNYLRFDCDR